MQKKKSKSYKTQLREMKPKLAQAEARIHELERNLAEESRLRKDAERKFAIWHNDQMLAEGKTAGEWMSLYLEAVRGRRITMWVPRSEVERIAP